MLNEMQKLVVLDAQINLLQFSGRHFDVRLLLASPNYALKISTLTAKMSK